VRGRIDEPESVTREREEAEEAGDPLDPAEDLAATPPGEGLRGARIAFGPFLVVGAIEYLLFGQQIIARWASWLLES
jgi:hypothetical protein